MKKIGSLLLVCLFFFFPFTVKAEESGEVEMYLSYGFQDNVRSGSCFPLKVFLENRGDAFEGTLEVLVPVQAESQELSSSFLLGEDQWGSSKDRIYCYQKEISLNPGEERQEIFYLELPSFEGNLHVCLRDGEDRIWSERDLTCSFSENNARVLVGMISSDEEGLTELDGMQIRTDNGYGMEVFVKVISLKAEDIYSNPDAISQLDVLIVDKGTEFSEEQQSAVKRWENSGGFYLERDGENLYTLFQNFMTGEQKEQFQSYVERMVSYSFGDEWGLSQVPVREKPSMGKFFILLCIYAVAVGPVLYIFLREIGKQKYIWTCVCALSIIFMGIIGILGKKTNIYAPFISYSGLYEQQDNIWSETAMIGIQAPYNNDYHLYLDSEYRLTPVNLGMDSLKNYHLDTAEKITIHQDEESNKITLENIAAFTQSCFKMEKEKNVENQEKIQIHLSGDGESVSGTWENPTAYRIKNAVLVMQNRIAVLGEMDAYGEGEISECPLYSYGNAGIDLLMKDKMDFQDYQYPEYEINNLSSKIWDVLRNGRSDQIFLLGIVENPDLSFQENSGYKIYGSALFQMPAEVDWEKDGYLWCPNLEIYGVSKKGEFSSETNLMHGKEATVDYRTDMFEKIESLTFFHVDYDDEKYFFPFQGNVALYCWSTGIFEEIQDWETTLTGEKLERFLSAEGTVRVRYLLDDTINTTERSCMLPCLRAAGKVE